MDENSEPKLPESPEPNKSLFLFGRDVSKIPCFRNSLLYGISGGAGIGLLTFLGTSRIGFATNVGFGSFICGSLGCWAVCRYQWSKAHLESKQFQEALRKQAMYEGTEVERNLDLKSA